MKVANIQTTVVMDDRYTDREINGQNVAMHITVDPIDQIKRCEVYTDDGYGNGVLIFKFEM